MLDTRFPRLPGDIGNPASFDFPVSYERVAGASVGVVVDERPLAQDMVEAMVAAARRLRARGATVIGTSCGYLGGLQRRLEAELEMPVLSSSLRLLPGLRASHGADATLGVLTFSRARLRPHHFGDAWHERLVVEGLDEDCHLATVIREDLPTLDRERAARDAVAAATRLRERAPRLAAVVLECTNLAPYRRELGACLGVPLHDIVEALHALARGTRVQPAGVSPGGG